MITMYVHPDHHRRGLGRLLSTEIWRISRDMGLKSILCQWIQPARNFVRTHYLLTCDVTFSGDHGRQHTFTSICQE